MATKTHLRRAASRAAGEQPVVLVRLHRHGLEWWAPAESAAVAPKYSVTYPAVPGAQPTTQIYDSLLAARAAAKVASQDRGDLRYQDVVIRTPRGVEYAGPVR